jgi:polyhydroxyalkanoate synthesis regulator phasin
MLPAVLARPTPTSILPPRRAGPWAREDSVDYQVSKRTSAACLSHFPHPPLHSSYRFLLNMTDKPIQNPFPSAPTAAGSSEARPGADATPAAAAPRTIGQRTSGARDAMAEMAERAQLISQEAGTKIAAAMKDVIGAAAGIAGFAVESARDLVQYMVRRGQITQDEADKLIKEAEDAHGRRTRASKPQAERPAVKAERPRETAQRDEVKPAASAKRTSGATAAARPEKKPAAKRPAAQKKPTKPSPTKKRR